MQKQTVKKFILRIHKANLKNDNECYMEIIASNNKLPEIDSNKYFFDYFVLQIGCDTSLCWLEK